MGSTGLASENREYIAKAGSGSCGSNGSVAAAADSAKRLCWVYKSPMTTCASGPYSLARDAERKVTIVTQCNAIEATEENAVVVVAWIGAAPGDEESPIL